MAVQLKRLAQLSLTLSLGACMKYVDLAPQAQPAQFALDSMQVYRLILISGDTAEAAFPQVARDSVIWDDHGRQAVAEKDVRAIARKKLDVFTTVSAIGIVTFILFLPAPRYWQ